MRKRLPKIPEEECVACGGTGLKPVEQPTKPGLRIFPARCKICDGKGRVEVTMVG
jgi:hypothetical protein